MSAQTVTIVILATVIVAGAYYFLVALPGRWRRPLESATGLLYSGERADFETADRLVGEALNAGPRGRALADARFVQALVRARLGEYEPEQYAAASTAVAALVESSGYTEETAFLDLWLRSKQEQHAKVCDLFEKQERLLRHRQDARVIASVSFLRQGVASWRRREPQGALHYFGKVRELGELANEVPEHVNDLELVEGIQAVFDERPADAERCFTNARDRSEREGASSAQAELGLLVCRWRAGDREGVDARLGHVLNALDADRADDQALTKLFAHTALFHAVTLLYELRRPEREGTGVEPSLADLLDSRARQATMADPDYGDAFLVAGVFRYFVHGADPEQRERAVSLLEQGLETGRPILLREVREIVEFERALGSEETGLARYLQLISELVADPGLDEARRAELRALEADPRLSPYLLAEQVDMDRPVMAEPTLRALRERRDLTRTRMRGIVGPKYRNNPEQPGMDGLKEQIEQVEEAARHFEGAVESLQEAEQGLMLHAAEYLLREEGPA
ncbi:hypothetical protein [Nonomuraea sp. NPDC050310]|uniref:hypothetical protein n=1 Tax=unclassified Nonomuraea TaxID=2593643 RepID=UPI0033F1FD25